jgi:hypothetical protein
MNIQDKFPAGLSWGVRGLRVGKSTYGNWWVSFSLPLGFRYTWMLGKNSFEKTKNQLEESKSVRYQETIKNQNLDSKVIKSHNQEILEKIKKNRNSL